jgi:glycosyltransferase involved in cell wall biosynthesis
VTRTLGRELARKGLDVSVVTVRRTGQREVEELEGVTVYGYPSHSDKPYPMRAALSRLESAKYYRIADADIYHSEAESYNTIVAERAMAGRRHVITFQDPYDSGEWERIGGVDPRYRPTAAFRARCALENRILASACRRADALYSQARFLIGRATRLYGLRERPGFLPNPVRVPRRRMMKAERPTICFLARWDPQKRVEFFLRLAERFPEVKFVAMGRAHDAKRDAELRRLYRGVQNLRLTGFVSEEEKSRILERSWALVNTSVREALPVSFLEALAHETPIVSGEDPDGLTSRFGFRVLGDDYDAALSRLLESGDWAEKGRSGRRYVEEVHELGRVVRMHVEAYEGLMRR